MQKTLKKRRLAQYREAFKNIDDDKMAIVERTIDFAIDLEFRLDNLQKNLDKDGFYRGILQWKRPIRHKRVYC